MTFEAAKKMTVVNCGASGHNMRSKPSLKAPFVGTLFLGSSVMVLENVSFFTSAVPFVMKIPSISKAYFKLIL